MEPLRINPERRRFRALIGVGGIGYGSFFALNGNQTLGREESRQGHFLDRRDYCKLHIIAHYVKTLLGPDFPVIPIGKVGEDDGGRRLMDEMREAGLDLRYVTVSPGAATLFSFCFVYPDGSGGNLTTDASACQKVTADLVQAAEPEIARYAAAGLALAAPEVPLAVRAGLLALGKKHRLFTVASFVAAEIPRMLADGLVAQIDLLALNRNEAAAAAGISDATATADTIVEKAVARLVDLNPRIIISVTAGQDGSWIWDGATLTHAEACRVEVVSTAGAGDAHLAGIISGLAAGLAPREAQALGTLTAARSVTSPHTIDKGLDRRSLHDLAQQAPGLCCPAVTDLLGC